MNNAIQAKVSVPAFVDRNGVKSSVSTDMYVTWSQGDSLGIFSSKNGSMQTPSQLALILSSGEGMSVAYSHTTGWELNDGGEYKYVSYYPFSGKNSRDEIIVDYSGQIQTENNTATYLGGYDYLYSDAVIPESQSTVDFSLHHIGSLVNVNISVPKAYRDTTFRQIRLVADTNVFVSSATYSVQSIASDGIPAFKRNFTDELKISFGKTGIKPTEGVIRVWFMMFPAQIKDVTIKAKLCVAQNNVTSCEGSFKADENLVAGGKYSYSVTSSAGSILPDKPKKDERLYILLFGHSFARNCFDYLPAITQAAGINNVFYARWYQGDCSLKEHWGHVVDMDTYSYNFCIPGKTSFDGLSRRVIDVLRDYPWDIILFQQSTSGERNYSTYQPELNYLSDYVIRVCEEVHGKTPVIGWNMFWSFNSGHQSDYDRDATKNYEATVQAAKDMIADTDIRLVVPAGTGMQNARGTSLNDPGSAEKPSTTRLFTADGWHASSGVGRYVTACTWFQTIIAPIYGVDITGNTYRPTGPYTSSFPGDEITDKSAPILQKCAVEAAKHPFEVTKIQE